LREKAKEAEGGLVGGWEISDENICFSVIVVVRKYISIEKGERWPFRKLLPSFPFRLYVSESRGKAEEGVRKCRRCRRRKKKKRKHK